MSRLANYLEDIYRNEGLGTFVEASLALEKTHTAQWAVESTCLYIIRRRPDHFIFLYRSGLIDKDLAILALSLIGSKKLLQECVIRSMALGIISEDEGIKTLQGLH